MHGTFCKMSRVVLRAFVLLFALAAVPAWADPADVVAAELTRYGGAWSVSVTIRHGDTGWNDYADGWRVETPEGEVLGTRVLHHPHVEEQPFTRSLGGVTLPPHISTVMIRARTSVTGWAEDAHGPFAVPGRD